MENTNDHTSDEETILDKIRKILNRKDDENDK